MSDRPANGSSAEAESLYAWVRLFVSLAVVTIGNAGMYAVSVVLPTIQTDFGVDRAGASLPYASTMIGFGVGGILMGRLADRRGIFLPVSIGAVGLSVGFFAAAASHSIVGFNLVHGIFIGLLGSSAMFAPMVADASHWFTRHRGVAVAVCMSGNYLAGVVWPPLVQYLVADMGWRLTYQILGVLSLLTLLPLAFCLRRHPPSVEVPLPATTPGVSTTTVSVGGVRDPRQLLGLSPRALLVLLSIAGVACCVAMAMPQVQIVAYCGDLGYGTANGANMLSLMLAMGIISRLGSGWLSDQIGGLRTLLLGSVLQALALWLYVFNHGLLSLYVISALFGLFQGGIVPAYAVIVREYFPPKDAGTYVGIVLMATLVGMALGGWMSGAIYDLSLSYQAAFLNGIAWNALNALIVIFLLYRGVVRKRRLRFA